MKSLKVWSSRTGDLLPQGKAGCFITAAERKEGRGSWVFPNAWWSLELLGPCLYLYPMSSSTDINGFSPWSALHLPNFVFLYHPSIPKSLTADLKMHLTAGHSSPVSSQLWGLTDWFSTPSVQSVSLLSSPRAVQKVPYSSMIALLYWAQQDWVLKCPNEHLEPCLEMKHQQVWLKEQLSDCQAPETTLTTVFCTVCNF